jgi:hypothetical protein
VSAHGSSFRRRLPRSTVAVLADETASLIAAAPGPFFVAGIAAAAPLGALLLAAIFLYRGPWLVKAWDGPLLVQSLFLSVAIVAAFGLRCAGHGLIAQRVAAELQPEPLAPSGPRVGAFGGASARTALRCAALGTVSAFLVALAGIFAALPALVAAGWLFPAIAVAAVEDRDAGPSLARLSGLPGGTTARGTGLAVLLLALYVLIWVNFVQGVQILLLLLRAVVGLDVSTLSRALAPTNPSFLLGAALVAWMLLEPFSAVLRGVHFLDARLRQSGADLQERWAGLRPAVRGDARISAVLLSLLLPFVAAGAARAQDFPASLPEALPPAPVTESDGAGETPLPVETYRAAMDSARVEVERAATAYEASGFEDLSAARAAVSASGSCLLELPDGRRLEFDGSALAAQLPDWVHTQETQIQARSVSARVAHALVFMDSYLRVRSDETDPRASGTPSPAAALGAELASGGYRLPQSSAAGDEYRASVLERARDWFARVWQDLNRAPEPSPWSLDMPSWSGRALMILLSVALTLAVAFFLLQQGPLKRRGPALPDADPLARGAGLPDARDRSPLGWRAHADRLAAQGLHRDAVRALYLASLARLDRSQEIEYRPERTNGEHLRSFRGASARKSRLADATLRFEGAWYGLLPAGLPEYQAMARTCDPLVLRDRDDRPVLASEEVDGAGASRHGRSGQGSDGNLPPAAAAAASGGPRDGA